jgi:hypothetical protein
MFKNKIISLIFLSTLAFQVKALTTTEVESMFEIESIENDNTAINIIVNNDSSRDIYLSHQVHNSVDRLVPVIAIFDYLNPTLKKQVIQSGDSYTTEFKRINKTDYMRFYMNISLADGTTEGFQCDVWKSKFGSFLRSTVWKTMCTKQERPYKY